MECKVKVLLKKNDFKPSFDNWKINGVFNPGGVRTVDGKIVLYVRIAEKPLKKNPIACPIIISEKEYKIGEGQISKKGIIGKINHVTYYEGGECALPDISHFKKILIDKSGFFVEKLSQKPVFTGLPRESEYGVEDPRITKIGNIYYMTYVGVSKINGISTFLAASKDCDKWKRLGLIFKEQNKDVVLFPEKVNGLYVALNRPESWFTLSKSDIWISYSPDLVFWGKDFALLPSRKNAWDEEKNGAGCPPIKTDRGWLIIYHGVKKIGERRIYSAGAVLLDLKNPNKVLMRSPPERPLLKPEESFEKEGFVSDVVFPTSAILDDDKKSLLIYSGGGDSVISVRKILIKDIFRNMENVN